jgi:hypothetical protein
VKESDINSVKSIEAVLLDARAKLDEIETGNKTALMWAKDCISEAVSQLGQARL